MSAYRLTHLDDATLLSDLSALVARERTTTAELLAHIAEVDERRLYLPAGYSSMFAYCLGELRLSDDATYKRIQAARACRRFPRLFEDVAAGQIHLTGVGLIAPHLTAENVDELVTAAVGRRKAELEVWLAGRFGSAAPPRARVIAIKAAPTAAAVELAPAQVVTAPPELALAQVARPELAPAQVEAPRYVVQVPIREATHAKLRRAQVLLAHAVPSGALDEVLDRALDALLERLEKRKGAAPVAERAARPASGRTIPARVRREVWKRDGGRCTFEGPSGARCDTRRLLEFDHVIPFARGGESTVDGLRLRCRAHNQLEAERAFGRDFIQKKRTTADPEVEAALRGLGCRAEEARRAAGHAATLGATRIEDRLRGALQFLGAQRAGRPMAPA